MNASNNSKHYHQPIPDHSPDSAKLFYALCGNLGHNPEEAKERACKKAGVSCFNRITQNQLNQLIEMLQKQDNARRAKEKYGKNN